VAQGRFVIQFAELVTTNCRKTSERLGRVLSRTTATA
jgi:hypothetical protein